MVLILLTIFKNQPKGYFNNLNASFLTEKVVLKIKPNSSINEPINFVNIISDDIVFLTPNLILMFLKIQSLHKYFRSSISKDGFINHRNE